MACNLCWNRCCSPNVHTARYGTFCPVPLDKSTGKNRVNRDCQSGLNVPLDWQTQTLRLQGRMLCLACARARDGEAQRTADCLSGKRIKISAMPVRRAWHNHQAESVVKRRKQSEGLRCSKEVPGERVQLDVTEIRNGACQFTATDDAPV